MKKIFVLDLLDLDLKDEISLNLKCISGRRGLKREVTVPDLNRPGLALSGFFDSFAHQRIQVFGMGETAYLRKLESENNLESVRTLFSYDIPCCIFTHNLVPNNEFLKLAEESGCPILQTDLPSSEFSIRILRALGNIFAPQITIHGVFIEVFGLGVLLLGDSGVGKSEAALELIERGHRLVADDAVEIRCISGNILQGSGANKAIGHHMEIRGIGIINVTHLFGVGAIRDKKQIQVVIKLEEWDPTKNYDRLGSEDQTTDILGVHVPYLEIPVKSGRNIPILIETAAMNERLKIMGYYSAQEFNQNVIRWLESENARKTYLQKNEVY